VSKAELYDCDMMLTTACMLAGRVESGVTESWRARQGHDKLCVSPLPCHSLSPPPPR
jgi:hypothetical protein